MTGPARHSLSRWKFRHGVVVWIGIALNLLVAVPLLFAPLWVLGLFDVPAGQTIWPRFAGGLLILLSVFYIPMTWDLDRHRIFAWLAVFPARSFGVVFFLVAVLGYSQPAGFFVGVLIDGAISIASLYCLIRIVQLEQDIATGRAAA